MRTLTDLFKALSQETRLLMLGLLLEAGELCVYHSGGTPGARAAPRQVAKMRSVAQAASLILACLLLPGCGSERNGAAGGGSAPRPGSFTITVEPTGIAVARSTRASVLVSVIRSGGFEKAVDLAVQGLPPGVTASSGTIGADEDSLVLSLEADESVLPGGAAPTLVARAPGLPDQTVELSVTVLQYVEHHDAGFEVRADGHILGHIGTGERALLNILPAFGRGARLSLQARWPTEGERGEALGAAALSLRADWRYRPSSPWVDVHFAPERGVVRLRDHAETAASPHEFEPGRWYTLVVQRHGEQLSASVDGREVLRTTLQPKEGVVHVADDADVGGFALVLGADGETAGDVELRDVRVSGEPSAREYRAHHVSFPIGDVEHRYSVIHEAGFEAWAHANAQRSAQVLQAAARLYGVPPLASRLGSVQSGGEYFAAGFGYNSRGVIQERGHDGPVAPPCHELMHNWQHLYGERWSNEGSAELGCRAIGEVQDKVLMTADNLGLRTHLRESFSDTQWGRDFPLDDHDLLSFSELPTDDYWRAFWKATVFTLVIYRLLGAEGYAELHRRALGLGQPMDSAQMLDLAQGLAGRDLDDVVPGWLAPGRSVLPIELTFDDSDGDGLGDLDELLLGTDGEQVDSDGDGHRDRHEIAAGFDPLDPGQAPPPSAIVIDGDGTDWSTIEPVAEDPPEDVGDADFATLRYVGDATNGQLHLRVDYREPFEPDDGGGYASHVTFDFDLDGDRGVDYRVNLFFRIARSNAFLTRGWASTGTWDDTRWTELSTQGAQVAFGHEGGVGFVEASIPWELFEAPTTFEVNVAGGSPRGSDRFDSGPIRIDMQHDLPQLPHTVWTPRP